MRPLEVPHRTLEETRRAGAGASDWQNHSIGPLRMRVDLRPRLGEIPCPVLLIQGTEDIGVRAHHTAAAARAVPGAAACSSTGPATGRTVRCPTS